MTKHQLSTSLNARIHWIFPTAKWPIMNRITTRNRTQNLEVLFTIFMRTISVRGLTHINDPCSPAPAVVKWLRKTPQKTVKKIHTRNWCTDISPVCRCSWSKSGFCLEVLAVFKIYFSNIRVYYENCTELFYSKLSYSSSMNHHVPI